MYGRAGGSLVPRHAPCGGPPDLEQGQPAVFSPEVDEKIRLRFEGLVAGDSEAYRAEDLDRFRVRLVPAGAWAYNPALPAQIQRKPVRSGQDNLRSEV
jgi:hypothetical protein